MSQDETHHCACGRLAAELQSALERLARSEARLADAQQNTGIGSWEWTLADNTEWWSDEMYRLCGFEPNSFRPTVDSFRRVLHPQDVEALSAAIRKVLDDGEPVEYENRIIRRDGHVRTLQGRCRAVVDAHGQIVRVVGTAQDITERKAAEETVRRSERRLKTIIDAQPACVKLVSPDGVLLDMNPAGLTMIGADDLSQVLGRRVIELVHPEDRARYIEMHRTAASGVPVRWEFRIIGFNGAERWVDSRSVPFELADSGDAVRRAVLSVTSDETERKRLESHLRQAHKMEAVGRLAGGIAHDFNNLLTAIGGYVDMALTQLGREDRIARDLQHVQNAAQAAASLTRQLLFFSRNQTLRTVPVDLNEVIAGVEPLLRRIVDEDIVIDTALGGDLDAVQADPTQIQQVIMNLGINARDAMPNGGSLRIETANVTVAEADAAHLDLPPGRYVRLTVIDTGIGMDAATREHIFEPFFTTKGGNGTGLGLATVYAIAQQLGGAVSVQSEVGRGTTFTLHFPRSATRPVRQRAGGDIAGATLTGTETVLVVEDDENVRTFMARALAQNGYCVHTAESPAHAMALTSQTGKRPDVLLTDIVMPGMNGVEFAAHFQDKYPNTRILYMSGYTDRAMESRGVTVNPDALLHKPFTSVTLLQKLRQTLDLPAG